MATQQSQNEASGASAPVETVLFVDDEPEILEMYELLCGSEYAVLTAENGEAALEQFGKHVDMVFVDRRMPDMSGSELARTIRSEERQTPVGIISAVDPGSGPDVDPDVYLTKPITRDDLLDAIDEHVA